VGFTIVGLFLAAWLVSLAIWRIRRVEERWTGRLVPTDDDV
jgi:high-affinity nickel-transport protein